MKKLAKLRTQLQPHQQRVVDRIQHKDQPGLVVAHGLGSGKCVRGETPVLTNYGLFSIRELFGAAPDGPEDETLLPGGDLRVASYRDGITRWHSVRHLYRQRISDDETTILLTTKRGSSLESTRAHPFLVARNGRLGWVRAEDLQLSDWVAVAKNLPVGDLEVPEDLIRLLAWQVAEGWENEATGTTFITQDDDKILEGLLDSFRKVMPSATTGYVRRPAHKSSYLEISSVEYRKYLESLGYRWGKKAAEKSFPAWFSFLKRDLLSKVVAYFFDAEGHAGKINLEITLASYHLVIQIQYYLLCLGVRSSIHHKWGRATNGSGEYRSYWRLCLSGEDVPTFLDQVYRPHSCYPHKLEAMEKIASKDRNPNFGVPVGDLLEQLRGLGLLKACGLSSAIKQSVSSITCDSLVTSLRYLLSPEAVVQYSASVEERGGTAKAFAKRTLASIQQNFLALKELTTALEALRSSDLRFEPIASISSNRKGGFVYDLEIDSDEYNFKNYVAGSGGFVIHNTLSSIAAQDALQLPSDVVVPASLQANYKKELKKHVQGKHPKVSVKSMQNLARKGEGPESPLLIVDEAHRARESGTKTYAALAKNKAEKRLLLTGTPFYNRPSDISPLVNLAAGAKVLPTEQREFEDKYLYQLKQNPGLLARLRGVKPASVSVVHPGRKKELQKTLNKWVDFYEGQKENFPEVEREDVKVPMSEDQLGYYDTMMKKAPFWVRYKVKKGLPPTKQEAGDLNAFLGGVRQVSNTTAPYISEGSAEQPKVQKAYEELKKTLDANARAKAVVYSNYIDAGINPYKKLLDEGKVPYGEFTGQMGKSERDSLVKDYNDNKIRALLLSSAGGEGLDLKGTRLMQVLEPHWNSPKLDQVEGRAIRYGSHAHLPKAERNVKVQRFLATRPKSGVLEKLKLRKPGMGVDEYLAQMSQNKQRLNEQFRELLRQEQSE